MIQDLCEVFDDLSSIKPDTIEFNKNGVYAYNETFSKERFLFFAPDELGIDFVMDYKMALPIFTRLKELKEKETFDSKIENGVLTVWNKSFKHLIPSKTGEEVSNEITEMFDEDGWVELTEDFMDAIKFCAIISKIGNKAKLKYIVVKDCKMVATDGLVYVEHHCNVSDFSINERVLATLAKLGPTKLKVADNGLFVNYNQFQVWVPISSNSYASPINTEKGKIIDGASYFKVTPEMINKLNIISKVTEFGCVRIEAENGEICFKVPNRESYEKCTMEEEISFSGTYPVSKIQPFFIPGMEVTSVIFNNGLDEGPMVFRKSGAMVLIMNMVG